MDPSQQLQQLQQLFATRRNINTEKDDNFNRKVYYDRPESARVLLYIDRPVQPFILLEHDIRKSMEPFGTVKSVRIINEAAAAEIVLEHQNAATMCIKELDNMNFPSIGCLRIVLLNMNQSSQDILPPTSQLPMPPRLVDSNMPPNKSAVSIRRVCRIELTDIFAYEPEFSVTNTILGPNHSNIAYIMEQSKHKVDLSIKGKPQNDAPVAERLHLSISSTDLEAYEKALAMAEDLVQSVCEQFVQFCQRRNLPVPLGVGFRRHMYEERPNGSLGYLGAKERPKTWLMHVYPNTPPIGPPTGRPIGYIPPEIQGYRPTPIRPNFVMNMPHHIVNGSMDRRRRSRSRERVSNIRDHHHPDTRGEFYGRGSPGRRSRGGRSRGGMIPKSGDK